MQNYALAATYVVAAIALFALAIFLIRKANTFKIPGRREGEEPDYQDLLSALSLDIDSDEKYDEAAKRVSELLERDRIGVEAKDPELMLSSQEFRYLNQLRTAVFNYGQTHPWVYLEEAEEAKLLNLVSSVEEVVDQANRLVKRKKLKYGEAERLVKKASELAARCKQLVCGDVESSSPERLQSELQNLEHNMEVARRFARRGLRLYVAEEAGQIRYETNVTTLILRASNQSDATKAEELLRQALAQAEDPDADEYDTDLPRAKCSLAWILWYHRNEDEEALRLLRSAVRNYDFQKKPDDVFELLGDIARLSQKLGKYDSAKESLEMQGELVRRVLSGSRSKMIQNLHQFAGLEEQTNQPMTAEQSLREALSLAKKGHDDYTIHKCKLELALFLARQKRFKEACKLFDQLREKEQNRPGGLSLQSSNPETLLSIASCFEENGEEAKVQYYKLKARMAAKRLESLEAEPAVSTFAENVLSMKVVSWVIADNDVRI